MEKIDTLTFFIVNTLVAWAALLVFYLYQTNETRLRRRGYSEEYRDFIKKDTRARFLGIAVGVPLLEVLAALIVWLVAGEFSADKHLGIAAFIFVILVIPFPILEARSKNKKLKELAIKTKSEILVDFNYRTLHLVFKPVLEVIAVVFFVLFFVLYVAVFHPAILHVCIPWLLYTIARSARNLTRPGMRDAYLYVFVLMVVNHLFAGFHLIRETIKLCCAPWYGFIFGAALAVFLAGKLLIYLFNFPRFKKEIGQGAAAQHESRG